MTSSDPQVRLAEVLRSYGFDRPSDLALSAESGILPEDVPGIVRKLTERGRLLSLDGTSWVSAASLEALADRASMHLRHFHSSHPDEPGVLDDAFVGYVERKSRRGLGRMLVERWLASGRIKALGRYVCDPAHAPALSNQESRLLEGMLAELEAAGFQPPATAELKSANGAAPQRMAKLLKIAVATRQLVQIDPTIYLHASVLDRLHAIVRRVIESGGDASVSGLKTELGTTRKYAVPLLEYLDRTGFTRRDGDRRVLAEHRVDGPAERIQ